MLAARALGRAAGLGARCSASLAASGASAALAETAGAGKGRWSEYSRALARLGQGGPLGSWRDEEERSKAGAPKSLHTGVFLAQQGSTFNDPNATAKEAGRPTSGGGGPGNVEVGAGGGGYALLAAAHAGAAAACFIDPTAVGNFFFGGAILPEGFQSQALVKLLGCGIGAGAAASLGLKQLADANQLSSPTAQRLQLGLMGFAAGTTALHALYSPSITGTSLVAGATVMGLTFLVPYQHYVKTNGGLKPAEAVKSYFGAVPDHFKISGLQSGLYSLLTPVLALAGASYLFAPGMSLTEVFGFVKGVEGFFFWQAIGGGLMTVAPALTFSLKKLADGGRLGETWAKTLNAGLMAAALGHLAVLFPMMTANQGGPMLPWVGGAWATALLGGGLGIMGGGAAKAAAGRV